MTVLVADDDRTTRFILRQILRRNFGATIVEVEDGIHAIAALGEREFDLVLLDLHMPRLDGIGVLKAARGIPRLASLPVVILSADRDESNVRQALQLGVLGYLTKPFQAAQLSQRLEKLTAVAMSARGAAPAAG
jgi:two-component system, chemotaxis family, chemotaxis protein CheY